MRLHMGQHPVHPVDLTVQIPAPPPITTAIPIAAPLLSITSPVVVTATVTFVGESGRARHSKNHCNDQSEFRFHIKYFAFMDFDGNAGFAFEKIDIAITSLEA